MNSLHIFELSLFCLWWYLVGGLSQVLISTHQPFVKFSLLWAVCRGEWVSLVGAWHQGQPTRGIFNMIPLSVQHLYKNIAFMDTLQVNTTFVFYFTPAGFCTAFADRTGIYWLQLTCKYLEDGLLKPHYCFCNLMGLRRQFQLSEDRTLTKHILA